MTSYNRVNGLHVSENPWLLDDILRKVSFFRGDMIFSNVHTTQEWGTITPHRSFTTH